MGSTSLRNYQKQVDKWISQYPEGYWPIFEQLTRLQEELGEFAREINHEYGHKKKKRDEKKNSKEAEMGDVLFTLICISNNTNMDMDKCLKMALSKCYGRDKDRFQKKIKLPGKPE